MANSLENRVRELEASRLRLVARINALQMMAIGAWCHISLHESDPIAFAERLIATWKQGASSPQSFPGVDPSLLDVLSQEYQETVEELSRHLIEFVTREATKLGHPRRY